MLKTLIEPATMDCVYSISDHCVIKPVYWFNKPRAHNRKVSALGGKADAFFHNHILKESGYSNNRLNRMSMRRLKKDSKPFVVNFNETEIKSDMLIDINEVLARQIAKVAPHYLPVF